MFFFFKFVGNQFIEYALMMSSFYNLIAITISQFLDVIYPTSALTHFWKKYPAIALVSPWIIGFSFHIYLDVFHAVIINNICYSVSIWSSELEFKSAVVYFMITHTFLPFVVFCATFPQMVHRLSKSKTSSNGHVSNNSYIS